MAYPFNCPINIGVTGLTLLGTLINTSGTVHATLRNLACSELADGFYQFSSASIPDGYTGGVYFHTGTYTSGLADIDILATIGLNPRETENCDILVSSLGGMGTGPFSITVTVTDGTDPLQNVTTAIYDGNTLAGRLVTDVNGQATFSLAAGTYTATTYKAGYTSAPATGRTVTGNETGTLTNDIVMTASGTITPPVNPDLCRLYGYFLLPSGEPAQNIAVTATLVANRASEADQSIVAFEPVTVETDVNGYAEMDLVRTDQFSPTPTYSITAPKCRINLRNISLTTATQDLAELLPS